MVTNMKRTTDYPTLYMGVPTMLSRVPNGSGGYVGPVVTERESGESYADFKERHETAVADALSEWPEYFP